MSEKSQEGGPLLKPDGQAGLRRLELAISVLLRVGVAASMMVVIVGMTTSFIHHEDFLISPQEVPHLVGRDADFPHSIQDVLAGLRHFHGQSVIAVGLLALILTPILRVVLSIASFLRRRDWLYAGLTLIVLIVLTVSFLLGKAG